MASARHNGPGMRNLAMVLLAASTLSACSPRMKPVGFTAGTILTGVGAALLIPGATTRCSAGLEGLPCSIDSAMMVAGGASLGMIGLGTLLVTALSPSEPDPAAPDASPASPLAPVGPRPVPPPARSPAAPSGASLQPVEALSLRPAAERPSLMAFH